MGLEGFEEFEFTHDGKTRTVFRQGEGPAVLITHELAGLSPETLDFGRRVAQNGLTAVLPLLFGTPGTPPTRSSLARNLVHVCLSREFYVLARRRSSPITEWLRALCRHLHAEYGGPGVGAVGMCLTGGFALALMVDESVMAPVLSQPALPFPITPSHKAALGISDEALSTAKRRAQAGCSVLGLRFTNDWMCPAERFDTLQRELGPHFEGIEIDSSPNNPYNIEPNAHSVLTIDLVDEEGHPTREALERVLELLRERLLVQRK